MSKTFYDFFKELNSIPRPSHHEEKVADYLCRFAEEHNLKYRRDAQNCVVIEKPASPGKEDKEPVVILNHMDMVCVAKEGYLRDGREYNALEDEIRPYIETDENGQRWMKAEGTSLGADNGMGLSMALAILADDTLEHPALEVLTTTNEEDGMSGAEALSTDFIKGRKIINLDSEAYDEITVGAAGAYLQVGRWTATWDAVPKGCRCYRIRIEGGLGGHSGVDINKGRCNCNKMLAECLCGEFAGELQNNVFVCSMNGGTANASIASFAEAVVAVKPEAEERLTDYVAMWSEGIKKRYNETDAAVAISRTEAEQEKEYLVCAPMILHCISQLPAGVIAMRNDMPGTVMTSNNIGVVKTDKEAVTVSCHTRSFDNDEMHWVADGIRKMMTDCHAVQVDMLMDTGAWMENEESPLLALTCQTFKDVLGFEPKKVAMHFVLEAAYYVEKYPGVEMASIGPLIIEPHSTSERVNLDTADNIWKVTKELLRRV